MRQTLIHRWWIWAGVFALLFYLCIWRDPITRLEIKAAFNPTFFSGFAAIVKLPETSSLEQVIKSSGQLGNDIRILEVKKITPGKTAVLVDSERGEKIALVQYDGGEFGWMVQIRDL